MTTENQLFVIISKPNRMRALCSLSEQDARDTFTAKYPSERIQSVITPKSPIPSNIFMQLFGVVRL